MHGRSGRPSRGPPPGLDPQVGFQVLPPDGGHGDPRGHKSSKKKSRDHSRRGGGGAAGQSRRWASQNQLDVITEASDESRYTQPNRTLFLFKSARARLSSFSGAP